MRCSLRTVNRGKVVGVGLGLLSLVACSLGYGEIGADDDSDGWGKRYSSPKSQKGQVEWNAAGCGGGGMPTEWDWPVPSNPNVLQYFGNPIDYQSCGFHTGIDITGSIGTAMVAVADGRVVHVGPMWLSGATVGRGPFAIIVQHALGFYSTYGHNNAALVAEGDCVTRGQVIAEMGTLGYSSGPHIHFEMLEGSQFTGDWETPFVNACPKYVDPLDYLRADPNSGGCGALTYHGECEGDLLKFCQSNQIQVRDCAAEGKTCAWRDDTVGYTCLAPNNCGDVTAAGTCTGDVLSYCENNAIKTQDCAAEGKHCQWSDASGANRCVAEDPCGGLDYHGTCEGDLLKWCEGGQLKTADCAASGKRCDWQDDNVGHNCLTVATGCGDLDYAGECSGNTLRWCEGAEVHTVDCTATNKACGWQSASVGYNCLVSEGCGSVTYTGSCEGSVLTWCENSELQVVDCADTNRTCGWEDSTIGNNCL